MKLLVIHIPFLPAAGMAIFPFIFIKIRAYKNDSQLIRHEKIHLLQQVELLLIGFYLLYLLNYLLNLVKYRNHHLAYMNIVFEREAYAMEKNEHYLKQRPYFNWLNFFHNTNY